jgi:hypothetical protein
LCWSLWRAERGGAGGSHPPPPIITSAQAATHPPGGARSCGPVPAGRGEGRWTRAVRKGRRRVPFGAAGPGLGGHLNPTLAQGKTQRWVGSPVNESSPMWATGPGPGGHPRKQAALPSPAGQVGQHPGCILGDNQVLGAVRALRPTAAAWTCAARRLSGTVPRECPVHVFPGARSKSERPCPVYTAHNHHLPRRL